MSGRGPRGAAVALLVLVLVAGCSSKKDHSSSSTSTSTTTATVSLDDAALIVQRAAPDLPSGQAKPLLASWCAAARSGDRTPLVAGLRGLPTNSEPVVDEVLGALQKGAASYCPKDAAKAPDLLSKTYDELISSTTTTAAPPTTAAAAAAKAASVRTGTTVRRSSVTAATVAPTTTTTEPVTGSTTQINSCNSTGGSNGVSVGDGNSSSCSSSSTGG